MQDPDAAAAELTRCVRDLGFKGALVNGFSEVGHAGAVVYYDDPAYLPFWAIVEQLGVPFYLHPRDPLASREPIYEGHPWFMGPVWAFGVETALHALRLMASGLFDRHPRLTIILGHLGEGLPYSIWRMDHRLAKSSARDAGAAEDGGLSPLEFLSHDERQFPHVDARQTRSRRWASSGSCSRWTIRSRTRSTPPRGSIRRKSPRTSG